ncbi:MAG: hypothetical protein ACK4FV_05275 [Candidatus Nitrosocaldus sp.]
MLIVGLNGILKFMLEGLLEYIREGLKLKIPAVVQRDSRVARDRYSARVHRPLYGNDIQQLAWQN